MGDKQLTTKQKRDLQSLKLPEPDKKYETTKTEFQKQRNQLFGKFADISKKGLTSQETAVRQLVELDKKIESLQEMSQANMDMSQIINKTTENTFGVVTDVQEQNKSHFKKLSNQISLLQSMANANCTASVKNMIKCILNFIRTLFTVLVWIIQYINAMRPSKIIFSLNIFMISFVLGWVFLIIEMGITLSIAESISVMFNLGNLEHHVQKITQLLTYAIQMFFNSASGGFGTVFKYLRIIATTIMDDPATKAKLDIVQADMAIYMRSMLKFVSQEIFVNAPINAASAVAADYTNYAVGSVYSLTQQSDSLLNNLGYFMGINTVLKGGNTLHPTTLVLRANNDTIKINKFQKIITQSAVFIQFGKVMMTYCCAMLYLTNNVYIPMKMGKIIKQNITKTKKKTTTTKKKTKKRTIKTRRVRFV